MIGDVIGNGDSEIVVGADCEGSGSHSRATASAGAGTCGPSISTASVRWSYFVARCGRLVDACA